MPSDASEQSSWKPVAKFMMKATEQALEKGFMPIENFVNKSDIWQLKCMACNTLINTTYSKFSRNKNFGCPKCAVSNDTDTGSNYNIVFDSEEIQIMLKAKLRPLEPYSGNSANKWKCECMQCGQICFPRFYDVSKRNKGGCKPCSNKPDPEAIAKAIQVMREAKLDPIEPYKNASSPWSCKCLKCNEIVTPIYNNVRRGHGGCVYCQIAAFKPSQPAYLYLIHNKEFASYKIGIGNSNKPIDRLDSHRKAGWSVLKRYDFVSGKDAITIEKRVLRWIRKELGIPVHLSNEQFVHGGATETFSDEFISSLEVISKIEEFIRSL